MEVLPDALAIGSQAHRLGHRGPSVQEEILLEEDAYGVEALAVDLAGAVSPERFQVLGGPVALVLLEAVLRVALVPERLLHPVEDDHDLLGRFLLHDAVQREAVLHSSGPLLIVAGAVLVVLLTALAAFIVYLKTSLLHMPLEPGERLRSERGRAEVLFGDGSLVHLDEYVTLDADTDKMLAKARGEATSKDVEEVTKAQTKIAKLLKDVVQGRAEVRALDFRGDATFGLVRRTVRSGSTSE